MKTTSQPMKRQDKLVFQRAKQKLIELLESPDFPPGAQIPAERDLSSFLGVSRMTLRKAIDLLIEEGVLERRGNRGTFVKVPEVQRSMSQPQSLTRMLEIAGNRPGSKLLQFEETNASSHICQQLNIEPHSRITIIKRLRTVDDKAFCIETSYIPSGYIPELSAADISNSSSLYQLLYTRYGLILNGDEGEIRLLNISDQESEILEICSGNVALAYRGIVRDQHNRPVEYLISLNNPQRVSFHISNLTPPDSHLLSRHVQD